MKSMKYITPAFSWILSFLMLWSFLPICSYFFTKNAYAGGDATYKLEIPIEELRSLINELENSASNITGQAGIELRASITALSLELESRLKQLDGIAKGLWDEISKDIFMQLKDIQNSIRGYIDQVNTIARDRIDQLSGELAKRISQLSDEIRDRLNQLDTMIQKTIAHLEESVGRTIDRGRLSVLVVVDSFTKKIIKAVMIILVVIALLVIGVLAWRNILPKKLPQQIISGFVFLVFFVICGTFLFSNAALASIFGREIQIEKPEVASREGEDHYKETMDNAKSGATLGDLRATGEKAIFKLKYYTYFTTNKEEAKKAQEKIDKIQVLLNPPPKPEPIASGLRVYSIDNFSKYYDARVSDSKSVAKDLNIDPNLLFRTQPLRLNQAVISPGALHQINPR